MHDEELEGAEQPIVDDNEIEADAWAAAFEAVEKKNQKEPEHNDGDGEDAAPADGNAENSDEAGNHGAGDDGDAGSVPVPGLDAGQDGEQLIESISGTQEEIDQSVNEIRTSARRSAMENVYNKFMGSGKIRNVNGKLGATINDPDIKKVDRDGVATYYNPDTGRAFTGDNPRKQAQEWVDDYNEDLKKSFNQACAQEEAELLKNMEPMIQTIQFAPTYDKLDPVRKGMFDNIIEDYEIKDESGDVIGYSCDLNKVIAQVNRQVKYIQNYTKSNRKPATGPAIDMPNASTSKSGSQQPRKIDSLAAALEAQQDAIIEKRKNGKK